MTFVKKDSDSIETRVKRIELKSTYVKVGVVILFFMWILIIQFAEWNNEILSSLINAIVLAIVTYYVLYYFVGIFVTIFGIERPSEEYGEEKRKLTICLDCMLVYDANRLKCPECGKETEIKQIEEEKEEDVHND